MALLHWCFLGRVGYSAARGIQDRLAEQRSRDEIADLLLLLEHPPVLTLGRHAAAPAGTEESHSFSTPVVRTDRGGSLTYHGPGQLVGYPVMKLRGAGRGVRSFVSALEGAMCDVAATYGVRASARADLPGAWASQGGELRKLGSVGLGIRRGVSLHGCALNLDERSEAGFRGFAPCGLQGVGVTSVASCNPAAQPVIEDAAARLAGALAHRLGASWNAVEIPPSAISAHVSSSMDERTPSHESQRDPGPILEG